MPMLALFLILSLSLFAPADEGAKLECQSQLVRTDLEVYEIQPRRPNTGVISFQGSGKTRFGRLELSFAEGEFKALIEVKKISQRSNWFKEQSLLQVTTSLFDAKSGALLAISENHSNWIQSESMIRNKELYGPRVISQVHVPQSLQVIYQSADSDLNQIRSSLGLDEAVAYAHKHGLVTGKEPYRIDTVCTSTGPL